MLKREIFDVLSKKDLEKIVGSCDGAASKAMDVANEKYYEMARSLAEASLKCDLRSEGGFQKWKAIQEEADRLNKAWDEAFSGD